MKAGKAPEAGTTAPHSMASCDWHYDLTASWEGGRREGRAALEMEGGSMPLLPVEQHCHLTSRRACLCLLIAGLSCLACLLWDNMPASISLPMQPPCLCGMLSPPRLLLHALLYSTATSPVHESRAAWHCDLRSWEEEVAALGGTIFYTCLQHLSLEHGALSSVQEGYKCTNTGTITTGLLHKPLSPPSTYSCLPCTAS